MWPNPQFIVDLVSFTEDILNGNLHFLCSVRVTRKSISKGKNYQPRTITPSISANRHPDWKENNHCKLKFSSLKESYHHSSKSQLKQKPEIFRLSDISHQSHLQCHHPAILESLAECLTELCASDFYWISIYFGLSISCVFSSGFSGRWISSCLDIPRTIIKFDYIN